MPPPPLPPGRREASPGDQRAPPNPPPPPPHTDPRAGRGGGPPTPIPPPRTHRSRGATGAALCPPKARGGAPPPMRNGDAIRATAAGPAPVNPHRCAGATRTTEQEGGRAPHDPPVTTAHSEVTEGGFLVRRGPQGSGPRAAPHPPPTRGGTSAPTARARRTGARQRHGESQKGVPQAAARNESREAAARLPPPRPPTSPPAAGAPAPTPRDRGDGPPPAREGSRSVTRPPAPAAGSNGGREEQVGPRLRTGAPRRSCPEKPGGRELEWYGGPRPPWTARRQ